MPSINLKNKNWKHLLAGVLGIFLVLATTFAPLLQGNVPLAKAEAGGGVGFTPAAVPASTVTPAATPSALSAGIANGAGGASEISAGAGGAAAAAPVVTPDIPLCSNTSSCIGVVVYVFTVPLMSVFAYVGDWVFSLAVQLSLNSSAYSLDFLTSSWAVVRDMANMAFIFILVYLAITIMFSAENPNTMRTLAATIIMALLINFSFFITRVVIDAGNILAVQFYNAIPCNNGSSCTLGSTSGTPGSATGGAITSTVNYITGANGANAKDLSATIMQSLGAQNLLSTVSLSVAQDTSNNGFGAFAKNLITIVIIYLATAAIFAMLAFAFLTVGFKFIMRIVALWFIIIAAPAAFAMRSLYDTSKNAHNWWDKWRDGLIQFSFYPAIFLFMFMLMNVVTRALGQCPQGVTAGVVTNGTTCGLIPSIFSATTTSNAAGVASGTSTALITIGGAIANVGLRLGIVLIMLYYGLKVADMLVAQGTGAAKSASNWVGRRVGAMTYGTASFAARQTIGRGANAAARSNFVNNTLERIPLVGGLVGDLTRQRLEGVASSRLDMRNAPGARKGLSILSKAGSVDHGSDLGAGDKGGYLEGMEKRKKALEARAKAKKPTDLEIQKAFTKSSQWRNLVAEKARATDDTTRANIQRNIDREEKRIKDSLEGTAKVNIGRMAANLITARGAMGGNTLAQGAIFKSLKEKSKEEKTIDAIKDLMKVDHPPEAAPVPATAPTAHPIAIPSVPSAATPTPTPAPSGSGHGHTDTHNKQGLPEINVMGGGPGNRRDRTPTDGRRQTGGITPQRPAPTPAATVPVPTRPTSTSSPSAANRLVNEGARTNVETKVSNALDELAAATRAAHPIQSIQPAPSAAPAPSTNTTPARSGTPMATKESMRAEAHAREARATNKEIAEGLRKLGGGISDMTRTLRENPQQVIVEKGTQQATQGAERVVRGVEQRPNISNTTPPASPEPPAPPSNP